MKDNVFWGIFAAIIVVWLAGFYFLGIAKRAEFNEKNEELSSSVKQMERLAKSDPLPTEERAEVKEKYYNKYKDNYRSALEVMQDRDEAYEKFLTTDSNPGVVEWEAAYRDRFAQLENDYRTFAGLDADAKMPFSANENISTKAQLPEYQKRFRALESLVRGVMQFPGASIDQVGIDEKPKGMGRLDNSKHFDRKRWTLDARVSNGDISALVSHLLSLPDVTFEVQDLIVAKDKQQLQGEVVKIVETGETAATAEPHVRMRLVLNALDWTFKEESEDEEKG